MHTDRENMKRLGKPSDSHLQSFLFATGEERAAGVAVPDAGAADVQ